MTGKALIKYNAMDLALSSDKFDAAIKFANRLIRTGFLPAEIKTPEQAIAIMMMGQELGLQPMYSLRNVNVIKGKPCLNAEGQLALFRRAGGQIQWIESTDKKAIIKLKHPQDEHWQTFSYTIEDAGKAGLLVKDVWKKYPQAMLRARVISAGLRAVAPEIQMGVYLPDEIENIENADYEEIDNVTESIEPEEAVETEIQEMPSPAPPPPPPPPPPKPKKDDNKNPNSIYHLLENFAALKEKSIKITGTDQWYYHFLESLGFKKSNKIPHGANRISVNRSMLDALTVELKSVITNRAVLTHGSLETALEADGAPGLDLMSWKQLEDFLDWLTEKKSK